MNSNRQVEEETFDLGKAQGVKEKKTNELIKQKQDLTRDIIDVTRDC